MVIDELIYKQKKYTWTDLCAALSANWNGYDTMRKDIVALHRYGAGGALADSWARWLSETFACEYEKFSLKRGNAQAKFVAGLFSMGIHVPLGKDVGATPDGRFAGEMISGSVAPSLYAEHAGYTASHKAAANLATGLLPNGVVFNQVMSHNLVARQTDVEKWAALLRTYFQLGGMSVQYSVLDAEELRNAQQNPQEFRDLIVRIGGYSARFVDLPRQLQDDFIARV
jgi:formate C-acetyltransferase